MKILETIFAFGIIVVVAVVSVKAAQESCDGPVVVSGFRFDCSCLNVSSGTDKNPPAGECIPKKDVGYRNDYTTCGGCGYDSCTKSNQIVGYIYSACITTYNLAEWVKQVDAYEDCIRLNNGQSNPPIKCEIFWCDYNSCTMPTSGGTPIKADVEVSLGDANDCCD